MTVNRETSPIGALYVELRIRPTATVVILAAILAGICALILGAGASRAFTVIGGTNGGPLIAHLMGALLTLGGLITVAGIIRLGSLVELLGLVFVSAGWAIYGAGVLIGLHRQGLIAGIATLGLSIGLALRVLLLSTAAKKLYDGPG